MISSSSETAIKNQMDIVDIVSNYIELKKSGGNFKANCPFHTEKTPSFVVSPSKQIYHCFSCKVGGDAIQFVKEYEKLNYPEALEKIADMIGVSVEYDARSKTNAREHREYMEKVNSFYAKNLDDSHREYLYSRGLTETTIREWGIGYSPRNPKTKEFLESNFLPLPMGVEVGVMAEGKGRIYDRFHERITIPIRSHTGNIIGFAGRTLKDDKKIAKYINSPDTNLFDKSSILFGFDRAKEHIYKKKFFILHEGQFDIVLAHQAGVKTTIATQGTALTEKHLPILKKTGAKALIAYDGDNAGRESALKVATLLSLHDFDGGVVLFPSGDDPASMIADNRVDDYKKLLLNATPLIEFVLGEIAEGFDLTNPHNKNEALKECLIYLDKLNRVIATEYISFVSNLLNIDKQHVNLGNSNKRIQPKLRPVHSTVEDSLLLTIYSRPDVRDWVDYTCPVDAWEDKMLYTMIMENRADSVMMSGILAKEEAMELNNEQLMSLVKNKQRDYLKKALKNSRDFDEIMDLNNRLKKVS